MKYIDEKRLNQLLEIVVFLFLSLTLIVQVVFKLNFLRLIASKLGIVERKLNSPRANITGKAS